MSINDLLNDETLLPTMFVIFIVIMIIAIPAGIAMSKKANNDIYGSNEDYTPVDVQNAKIIARRTTPHPMSPTVMINMVLFELESGSRIEFAIKDPQLFSTMVEGDWGTLQYQGKKFIRFERNI